MLFRCFLCVLQFYGINYQSQISAGKSIYQMEYFRDIRKFGKNQKTKFRQKSPGEPEGLLEGSRGQPSDPQARPPLAALGGPLGAQAPPPASQIGRAHV